jgi:hypothetical protein
MSVQLPPLEGAGPAAPARRKAVRAALLASEVARARAIRVVRLASRQAPAGSQEWRAWVQLLQNLQAADPWRT